MAVDPEHYYLELASAYAVGSHADLAGMETGALLREALDRGLSMHRFKRTAGLPRVRKVIGVLKSFSPSTLLDIGSGRGAFLWPLLDELPTVDVTAVDRLKYRVADINTLQRGGIDRVRAFEHDASELPWDAESFEVATVLEVLEHVDDPSAVASEVLRVARAVVIASVPAKEDNNPEHIRLFTPASLSALFKQAGATSVSIDHVPGHMIAIAKR